MQTTVTCPFCAEETEISIDDEPGKQVFVQDCDICCHPLQIRARVTNEGEAFVDVDRA